MLRCVEAGRYGALLCGIKQERCSVVWEQAGMMVLCGSKQEWRCIVWEQAGVVRCCEFEIWWCGKCRSMQVWYSAVNERSDVVVKEEAQVWCAAVSLRYGSVGSVRAGRYGTRLLMRCQLWW